MSFSLSPCQEAGFKLLTETNENVFLTGKAGTGKSYLISRFRSTLDPIKFPMLASTGAAAVLVGGRTFHSFFGLGLLEGGPKATVTWCVANDKIRQRLKEIDGFILDEVSMIPGQTLDAAEAICQICRNNPEPWGGLRFIAVGDFMQLPPIARLKGRRDWAFKSRSWEDSEMKTIELDTLMRSNDEQYNRILNKVRVGRVDPEVRDFLNHKMNQTHTSFEKVTMLFPLREQVNLVNNSELEKLEGPIQEFITQYEADTEKNYERIQSQAPVEPVVKLAIDAYVMTRVNHPDMRYVNGSTGFVTEIQPDKIRIRLQDSGESLWIEKFKFDLLNDNGEICASAYNFPLSLAYAITIHKSQGATLDAMFCDLSKLWEPGQAYVAMSRLKSGAGFHVIDWSASSIRVDHEAVEFYESIRQTAA